MTLEDIISVDQSYVLVFVAWRISDQWINCVYNLVKRVVSSLSNLTHVLWQTTIPTIFLHLLLFLEVPELFIRFYCNKKNYVSFNKSHLSKIPIPECSLLKRFRRYFIFHKVLISLVTNDPRRFFSFIQVHAKIKTQQVVRNSHWLDNVKKIKWQLSIIVAKHAKSVVS